MMPAAANIADSSVEWSATCSRRCASDAVVKGTPAAAKRSKRGGAGYTSPTGFLSPADEHSAAIPDLAAASASRSKHSSGAADLKPATLMRSGCASTSQTPDAASSSIEDV